MNQTAKAFVASNSFIAFGNMLIELTLYWLLYAAIQNPILYIPVAAADPISKLAFSYIAGYLVDKYNKRFSVILYGTLYRVFALLTALCIIFHNPVLAVVCFLAKSSASTFSEVTVQTISFTSVSKEEIAKMSFYLRLTKEPSEILSSAIWPFLLPSFQAWLVGIGVAISGASVAVRGYFAPNERGKKKTVSLRDGAKEYIFNKTIFAVAFPLIIAEGAISMIYLYYAAVIQILHGTPFQYSLARIVFNASQIIGSWLATRITVASRIVMISFFSYLLVFISLIPQNPWLISLSLFGVGFGDNLYAPLLYTAFRTARQEIFGSIVGFDELATNAVRVCYDNLAGFLYDAAYEFVPLIGFISIGVFGLILYLNQNWKIRIR